MSTAMHHQTQVLPATHSFASSHTSRLLQRTCACGSTPGVDGECEECRSKQMSLQRSPAQHTTQSTTVPPIVHEVLGSSGQPLDAGTRAFMEPRFGHDFSRVKVHTDAKAAESAHSVNALAYTVGRDLVFGQGQYAPESSAGKKLLAHELSHVVQQGNQSAPQSKLAIGQPHDSFEQEADHIAASVIDGASVSSLRQMGCIGAQPAQLQRAPADDANASAGNESTTLTSPRFKGNAVLEACFENKRLLRSSDPDTEAIKIIQQALVDSGFSLPQFGVDGKFGKETKTALEQFQVNAGLTGRDVDGIIGPITMHLLDQRFAESPQSVKVPAQLDIKTLRAGQVPVDPVPETAITPTTFRDMAPNQPGSSLPGNASLVQITVEVGAEVKLFSTGDKIDPNKPDPCRSGEVNTQLHTKFELDGVGLGKRVHLFYHEPTWTLTLSGPCGQLPEIKSEVDLLNIEIMPKILEFSLKPGLTFAEGQLKPGAGAEVELKPFGRSNSFLSNLKFTLGVDATSEKDADSDKRVLKTNGTAGAAIEF